MKLIHITIPQLTIKRFLMVTILFTCFRICYSQSDSLSDKELCQLLHTIEDLDQSNFKNYEKRKELILANFDTIVAITKTQGFPRYQSLPNKKRDRRILNTAIMITFVHIMQMAPDKMLNEEIIALLKKELEEKRLMNKHLLSDPIRVFQYFSIEDGQFKFSEKTKQMYHLAIKEWGLEELVE